MYAGSHDRWSVLHNAVLPRSCWHCASCCYPKRMRHTQAGVSPASYIALLTDVAIGQVEKFLLAKFKVWEAFSLLLSQRDHFMRVCCWGISLTWKMLWPGCWVYSLPSPAWFSLWTWWPHIWMDWIPSTSHVPSLKTAKVSLKLKWSSVVNVTNFTIHQTVINEHSCCWSNSAGEIIGEHQE